MVLQKQTAEGTITAPVPDHKQVLIGTLSAIIRQSGVDRNFFVR
jgi:predicted RNA binding protein YcfA (HicA-like mRNA interferase family)